MDHKSNENISNSTNNKVNILNTQNNSTSILNLGNYKKLPAIKEEDDTIRTHENEDHLSNDDLMEYGDKEYQDVQNLVKDFTADIEDGDNEYKEALENYLTRLKAQYNFLLSQDEEENRTAEIFRLKMERLDEDIERAHNQIEEYKDENHSLESRIKVEIKQNPTIQANVNNTMIIDKIFSTTLHADLTNHPKFSKSFKGRLNNNLIESTSILRGIGGTYMKRIGASMYFLKKLIERYKLTKIPQEIQEIEQNFLNNLRADFDDIKTFESKVKVIYNNDSFLMNIDTDEKKQNYNFNNLKREVCDVFNIRKEKRKFFHIINDKFYVYCHRINVYDIHKVAIENNKSTLTWAHMELLDKMSIFMDRNTNIDKTDVIKSNFISDKDVDKIKNLSEIGHDELFGSEIEEYIRYYRCVEALYLFFKKDKEKEMIEIKYKEKLANLKAQEINEINDFKLKDDDENSEKQIENKYIEKRTKEENIFLDKLIKHKNRPEPPIYMSLKNIYYFRLSGFIQFLCSIIFALSIYFFESEMGKLYISDSYGISHYITDVLIFNPMYKNFMRNSDAYNNLKVKELIRSKDEMLIYLNIALNNLLIKGGNSTNNDDYNNVFSGNSSMYEILPFINLVFKTTQPVNTTKNETTFIIPNSIKDNLFYFKEYSANQEDTSPKYFDASKYDDLKDEQTYLCSDCISHNQLKFSANMSSNSSSSNVSNGDTTLEFSGVYGNYEGGGFYLRINTTRFTRSKLNSVIELTREALIKDPSIRMFMLSLNIIHKYYRSIIRLEFSFEFSTLSNSQFSFTSNVIDTQDNETTFYEILHWIYWFQVVLFLGGIIIRIFTRYLLRKRVKTISDFQIVIDIIIFSLLIMIWLIQNQSDKQLLTIVPIFEKFKNETSQRIQQFINYTDYIELLPICKLNNEILFYAALLLLLLFFRVFNFMQASPLFYYVIIISIQTAKATFNIMVLIIIFLLCYSLLFHATLGVEIFQFSQLSFTVLNSLESILGSLDTRNYSNLNLLNHVFIIAFLIFIKFILMTFIYAILKQTFEIVREEYIIYKKRRHFRLIGETITMYFKYMLPLFNLYWIVKDIKYYQNAYKDVKSLEKFVKEEETCCN